MRIKIILALVMSLLLPVGLEGAKKKSAPAPEKQETVVLTPEQTEMLKYFGANEAYVVMRKDSKIYSNSRETKEELNNVKELIVVQRGDTLMAGENTREFIDARRGKGVSYLPVVYRGIKGYTSVDNIQPIRHGGAETVYMIQDKPMAKFAAMERSLFPFQFKVMNIPVDPMLWMWIALGGLGMYVLVFLGQCFLPNIFKNTFIFVLIGSAVTSFAEIMYLLSMGDHILWFFNPKSVGWGLAILNFLVTGIVLTGQYWVFKEMWCSIIPGKDSDGDPVPHWVTNVCFMPGIMAVVTVVMLLIDAFTGNTWTVWVYASVYGVPVLAGLAAMGYLIAIRRPLLGVSAFLYYIVASVGLTVCLSILGLWLVVIAIALVVVVILGGSVLAVGAGMVNGAGERVTGYTSDGKKVTGYKDIYGNVKGNDGRTYTIND